MILDVHKGDYIGPNGHIYDASGVEHNYVVWCDTEEGVLVVLCRDENNRSYTRPGERGVLEVATKTVRAPAPLTVVLGECGLEDSTHGMD